MQPQYTGTQQRKKYRHRTRKFSEDEPYDRATDAMLANSSLSGGRKLSLQHGALIQAQPNSLKREPVMNFNQQAPLFNIPNTAPTSNFGMNTLPQSFNQSNYIYNTPNNIPVNHNIQNTIQQQHFINSNGMPVTYSTEGLMSQQGFTTTMPMNYTNGGLAQQGYTVENSGSLPTNCSMESQNQQVFMKGSNTSMPVGYATEQAFTQERFVDNTDTRLPVSYETETLTQPEYATTTVVNTEKVVQENYIPAATEEIISEQPLTIEPANEGLPQQPYPSSAHDQNLHQPHISNLLAAHPALENYTNIEQGFDELSLGQAGIAGTGLTEATAIVENLPQQDLNTAFLNETKPSINDASIATIVAETKKIDPNVGGVFTFKPLEGKFPKDKDLVRKMDPYCKIKIGVHSGKTAVAKNQGVHPVWTDVITLQKRHNEQFAKLSIKDYETLRFDQKIGETKIPLSEIASRGKINQWYPVYNKDQLTGEVLMEITFQPKVTNA